MLLPVVCFLCCSVVSLPLLHVWQFAYRVGVCFVVKPSFYLPTCLIFIFSSPLSDRVFSSHLISSFTVFLCFVVSDRFILCVLSAMRSCCPVLPAPHRLERPGRRSCWNFWIVLSLSLRPTHARCAVPVHTSRGRSRHWDSAVNCLVRCAGPSVCPATYS